MATAPYGVRLLVGAATMAVEETIRLPKTILMYPMTLASTAAAAVMRFQQNVAELVIKGDSTLEHNLPVEHFYDDVVSFWSQTKTNYTPTLVVTYGGLAGDPYWRAHMDVWKDPILSRNAPRSSVITSSSPSAI